MDTIDSLIREFAARIERVAAKACVERMLAGVKRPGERARNGRKNGPIQLCPVPKCKNRAAPVYGMLCAEHKSTPKKLVAKYREARRKAAAK